MSAVPASKARRREYLWLFGIVLVALLFRVVLASFPRVIRWDEPDYLWLGKSFLTGYGYTITGVPELHYTPLFSLLSGAIYLLVGNPEAGSNFWYVLFGAVTVVPVFFLARRIYGYGVAVLSAGLVAIFPGLSSTILYWGTMTEPLFIFLICCAMWAAAVALDKDKWWAYALVGGLSGLAYLARPEGLVWLVIYGLLLVLVLALKRRLFRWRTLAQLAICLAGFVLCAAPYVAFLYRHSGKWMPTGKLSITYDIGEAVLERDPVLYDKVTASLDSESGEILWWSEKRFDMSLLDIFLNDPVKFVVRTWRNAQRMVATVFTPTLFPLFLLAPIVLGWFRHPWTRRRLGYEALLLTGALPVLSFLPFHVEVRFFSPAFPSMLIWVAAGLWNIGGWLAETAQNWRSDHPVDDATHDGERVPVGEPERLRRCQSITAVTLFMLVLIVFGFSNVRIVMQGLQGSGFAHKAVGLWLKHHAPRDAAIMSRDLAISIYAERGFVASPRAEYDAYLDYARRKGATYLVVDERELRDLRPHLAFLLDTQDPPPELEAVHSAVDGNGRTIVYRIKD